MTNQIQISFHLLCFEAEFRSMSLRQSPVDDPMPLKKLRFSDLYMYIACSKNNVDLARVLLQSSPLVEINGKTVLHLDVQLDLVRLLVDEYGVRRHRTDSQARTPFQLASTEKKIRH